MPCQEYFVKHGSQLRQDKHHIIAGAGGKRNRQGTAGAADAARDSGSVLRWWLQGSLPALELKLWTFAMRVPRCTFM